MMTQIQIGISLLGIGLLVAITSTAITTSLFPGWSVFANGAVSGIWAGLVVATTLPMLRKKIADIKSNS